jgi:hypothetical protein
MKSAQKGNKIITLLKRFNSSFKKYEFLKDIGIEEKNLGAFFGKYGGKGKEVTSLNPSNNEIIATSTTVKFLLIKTTLEEYEECIKEMQNSNKVWRNV